MIAKIYVPDGKFLSFTKNENGVKKLFFSDKGALVVQSETETLNFVNMPCEISFLKEIK